MSDFDLEGLFIEPRPDEDGWEALLNLALEHIGGERSGGLSNRDIAELEAVLRCPLPFEVGMLLVMGVPVAEGWHQWDDPAAQIAAWDTDVADGFCFDIEHNDFWFDGWGQAPDSLSARFDIARRELADNTPSLFPIYKDRAVPLTAAQDHASSDDNPVFAVSRSDVTLVGADLAAWLHADFGVPLPMWPSEDRTFPFWTHLTDL